MQRADTELDPSRITKLIDKEFVWFDPQRGFCTDADNLKQSGIDKAFPYIFAAAMTAMSFGAGSTLAATVSSAAGGGTTGAMAVGATGAFISNASLQLAANGKINFGQLLRSTLAGGATAGLLDVTGLNSVPEGATLGQRLMNYTGRATLQGAIQSVMGGKFRDGFVNSMMGSVAAEVSQQLNSHIAQLEGNGSLSASEASAMRLLSRATGSALRIAGIADPAAGFASDFLGGLMQEGLATYKPDVPEEAVRTDFEEDPSSRFNGSAEPAANPAAEPKPAGPSTLTVSSGDTLERLARQQYGDDWRAGVTALVAANPGMTTNRWGSPIIQPGQTLNTPSLDGLNSDQLNRLGQTGGQIVANNSQGLNVRAQWLAAQEARRVAAQQPASGPATMSREEAYDLYMASGGRSGSFARQMGDEYKPVWCVFHAMADTIPC